MTAVDAPLPVIPSPALIPSFCLGSSSLYSPCRGRDFAGVDGGAANGR